MITNSSAFKHKTVQILFTSLLLSFLLFVADAQQSMAQSISGLGIRVGVNKPFADVYKFGTSIALQSNIAINRKWGFEPSIGYDKVNGKNSYFNSSEGPIFIREAESLDLIHLDLAVRYYIIPDFFVRLGPTLYTAGGNEDIAGLGIGGTAAFGYQLMLDKRNKLEFVFNTDLIKIERGFGDGLIPIAGLKVAYAFNFSDL